MGLGRSGSSGDRLLGHRAVTKHKSNFFKRPENALGDKWKVERARLFTAVPRGTFPKPGQLRGTGITGRENESLLGSLRLIQALTWLPEPALPQPSRAGEGRIASVGKVRLLKCEKLRKEGTVEKLDYSHYHRGWRKRGSLELRSGCVG